MTSHIDLAGLGWSAFFQSQLDIDEMGLLPVRVLAVHQGEFDIAGPAFSGRIRATGLPGDDEAQPTAGDWLLIDPIRQAPVRLLARKSLFKRKAAGSGRRVQLIAANVDTLFIVTSCNRDFNPARLERYLAVAREADVTPVIVIAKADQTDDAASYVSAATRLMAGLLVECIDARDPAAVACLLPWCATGQTVALVGSSGVGKSTLVNTLAGQDVQDTGGIREDDARGRHTTSGRSLHRLPAGGWIVDTPGMRELPLADVETGLDEVFADVATLADGCRFNDCSHGTEPGCAVRAAIEDGTVDGERLRRYQKLLREQAHNAGTLAERRQQGRTFHKMVKTVIKRKRFEQDQ